MSLPEELKDGKIGRFPVWAVGVVIAGAIILFVLWRNRRGAAVSTSDEEAATTEGESVAGIPAGSFLDNLSPDHPAYPVAGEPSASRELPKPITNIQWSRLAFDLLIGLGFAPDDVERALAKYIQGQPLTRAETSIKDLALRLAGPPPEGLIELPPMVPTPTRQVPGPAPTPTTPKLPPPPDQHKTTTANRRYVIVVRYRTPPPWNSTLWGIANHYGRTVQQLQQWNGIRNANLIFTGQRIWVDPP